MPFPSPGACRRGRGRDLTDLHPSSQVSPIPWVFSLRLGSRANGALVLYGSSSRESFITDKGTSPDFASGGTRKHTDTIPSGLTRQHRRAERVLSETELDERIAALRNGTDTIPPVPAPSGYFLTGAGGLFPYTDDSVSSMDFIQGFRWGYLPYRRRAASTAF